MTLRTNALRITATALALLSISGPPGLAENEERMAHQHLEPDTAGLIQRLQKGGHVLVIRHERTDASVLDDAEFDLADCATQRNLSVAGVANAVETARILRSLEIPVGTVRSSPMCRTLDTARLLFGKAVPEPVLYGAGQEPEAIRTGMHRLVIDGSGKPDNSALVTHLGTFSFVFGGHLAEGDAAVFAVEDGEPVHLGTIPANGWNDAIIDAAVRDQEDG